MNETPQSDATPEQVATLQNDLATELADISSWLPESLQPTWQLIESMPILGALAIALFFYLAAYAVRSHLDDRHPENRQHRSGYICSSSEAAAVPATDASDVRSDFEAGDAAGSQLLPAHYLGDQSGRLAGIVGIAVGFAAKDTLANLFSGFFIVADAPYKLGDYINLDSGERGRVTSIGLRSTRLLTRSDVDQVCQLLKEIGEANPNVCAEPAPRVRMRGFGASSLDFNLLAWIDKPENRGRISHELYMTIYKEFAEAGIEIPYDKHDVFIKELPERS